MKRNHEDVRVDIVQRATRETTPWSPASNKRFISDVYATIVADGRDGGMPLEEFKDVLLELQRRGDIQLARADLIAAMPFDKVQRSEIDAGGATFHFIVGPTANPGKNAGQIMVLLDQDRADDTLFAVRGRDHAGRPEMAIVSGETADRDQGRRRVTFFAGDGPLGHRTVTYDQEVADAIAESILPPYEIMTEADVMAWTQTPEYEIGSRKVAYVQALNLLSYYASKSGRRDLFDRANDAAHAALRAHRDPTVEDLERALDILHAAIRELPERNPRIAAFVRNPAWVTGALADHYALLDDQVPARWMPQLAGVTHDRKKLVADLVEFGCGAYGCVIATNDPKTVLKVTTDDTEAEFAADLAPTLVAPICVTYELVIRLSAKHEGRPVHLLWRESAEMVGRIEHALGDEVEGERVAEAIHRQHRAAQLVYVLLMGGDTPPAYLRKKIVEWIELVERMGRQRSLRSLAHGLVKVWEEQRIFFGDLHAGNLGLVKRGDREEWVITDPGHVAVIDDPDLWD